MFKVNKSSFAFAFHLLKSSIHAIISVPYHENTPCAEISGYTVYPSYTEWFEQHSEWEMLNMTSTIHNSRYLQFDMYIKRKPLFLCITLVTIAMIVVMELTTNRIIRILDICSSDCHGEVNLLPHNVDDAYNANSDSDVQPTKRECHDKKERKIDYIRYAATIDNICIYVLVTEMVIEFITVLIMFVKR
jgi:hypothetical protein